MLEMPYYTVMFYAYELGEEDKTYKVWRQVTPFQTKREARQEANKWRKIYGPKMAIITEVTA